MSIEGWIIAVLAITNVATAIMCWMQDDRIDQLEAYIERQTWRNL